MTNCYASASSQATLCVPEHTLRRALEGREVARLAAAHVVPTLARALRHCRFGVELEDANRQDDLQLSFEGEALPERRGADLI